MKSNRRETNTVSVFHLANVLSRYLNINIEKTVCSKVRYRERFVEKITKACTCTPTGK